MSGSKVSPDNRIFTLHKYFISANRMRTHFDDLLKGKTAVQVVETVEGSIYMSLWYGCLYTVIEGWRHLKLNDPAIDKLLTSSNVDLLKGYRHDTFHFQEKYLNDRSVKFMQSSDNPVAWVRDLNREFGRYFLNWFEANKS